MTHQVLVTWLAKESCTICIKFSNKLSYFLTNLGFFWLESGFTMSQVWSSHFRRSKWPLNGLFWWNMVRWFSQGCLIHSLKSWVFRFLFFLLQDLLTLLTVKSALFGFELKALQKYLTKNIIEFLGLEDLNLVANFDSFWDVFSFCPNLSSNFEMTNCRKLNF